jgi:hypothetical protein
MQVGVSDWVDIERHVMLQIFCVDGFCEAARLPIRLGGGLECLRGGETAAVRRRYENCSREGVRT